MVDAQGTVRVVAEPDDRAELPPPGEGVELKVMLATRPDALAVPEEALVPGAEGASLFVVEGRALGKGNPVRQIAVKLGLTGEGRVEVLEGLQAGDRVVVSGAAFLSPGAAVIEAAP